MPKFYGTINAYGALFEGATITPAIRRAAQKARAYGELRIRSRSPVRTGAMRAGWAVNLEGYGVRVTNEVPYTIFNEMGTRRMAARPMLAPTIPEMQEVFRKELGKEVGKALGAKIIGNLGDNDHGSSDPKDSRAYNMLTKGRNFNTPKPNGFKGNGKETPGGTLSKSDRKAYNKQFGDATWKASGS